MDKQTNKQTNKPLTDAYSRAAFALLTMKLELSGRLSDYISRYSGQKPQATESYSVLLEALESQTSTRPSVNEASGLISSMVQSHSMKTCFGTGDTPKSSMSLGAVLRGAGLLQKVGAVVRGQYHGYATA